MPRVYKRIPGSRPYMNYSEDTLVAALNEIRAKKISIRAAAMKYNIHRNTLMNKLKNKHSAAVGGPKALSDEEEKTIAAHAVSVCDFGFPITLLDLRFIVKAYLDRCGRRINCFKDNMPGREWGQSFLKRHRKDISNRFAQNITRSRAAVDAEIINKFFDNLSLELEGVPASNIWNYDETNLQDDPGLKKVISKRGAKYPERICNTSKVCTSLMICGNAEGRLAPPYVVYKAQQMWSTWTENGPAQARYNRTKSGWFDYECFEDWFRSLLLPILTKQEGKKVLIGDNLSSHLNLEVLRLCKENNIVFTALPPNSTHILQPLDVAFFRPMKCHWRKILDQWKNTSQGSRCSTIPKDHFPSLLKELMEGLAISGQNNLQSGFKKTGVFPVDRKIVLSRLPRNLESQNFRNFVEESFISYLESHRNDTTKGHTTKKRKRINLPPGKSISYEDLQDAGPSTSQGTSNLKKKRQKRQKIDSSSVDETTILFQDRNSDKSEENSDNSPQVVSPELLVGDYAIVKYEGELFPGLVTAVNGDSARVSVF